MSIEIQLVETNQQRREFVRLARRINSDQSLWVPNLERECLAEITPGKNPFYEHAEAQLFLAYRQGQAVGRIAAIENRRHNEHWQDKVGFFGHYEAIDDLEVSKSLFSVAEQWLRDHGLDNMRGPTNPSMNASVGFLSEGYEYSPTIPMPYTPPYYLRHAEAYGLKSAIEVLVYGFKFEEHSQSEKDRTWQRVQRLSQRVQQRAKVQVRTVRMDRLDEELDIVRSLCNVSLSDNWGFVPMSSSELRAARDELKNFVDPRMFLFAEIEGQPQAVFIGCPDYNEVLKKMDGRLFPTGWWTYLRHRRRIQKHVIYVYAATTKAYAVGAGVVLYEKFFGECLSRGITHLETGYVLDSNTKMRNSIENFGAEVWKRYQLYEKPLP
ncbi:hypothetical protein [Bythopirellula polymerisocia]|uniref:hypothetical protein n=1 Tax=Bythopirellula polymerisocia TaxID=2528003 RepID=UPI0011B63726|nr:hypothetical protein [Bythopirellula polymerisocia]